MFGFFTMTTDDGSALLGMRPLLRAVIARTLRQSPTHADVEDCTQECMKRGLEALSHIDEPDRKRAVMVGMARNVAADRLRQVVRRKEDALETSDDSGVLPVTDAREASDRSEARLAARIDARRMLEILARLPEGQQRALRLHLLGEHDYATIAEMMNVPLGTIATWIARGRAKLIEELTETSHP
jgi:RNA polymerase sigma factor (sigma-70 family)